ncbi:phosphatase PAP2 family protein [Candidatus Woesearchaeota archaeon]|nr:phosphatase PAP2 family protein [Candidatus Woesearchaeota archaeon]
MTMKEFQFKKHVDTLLRDITALGGFVFHSFLILFLFSLGEQRLSWLLFFAFLFTLMVTILIRAVYFKDRPHKQTYSNFFEKLDASSFPSLHTARTVALVLIVLNFIQNNLVATVLVGFSFLIIYSRVYLKKHDWEDVAGGIILGVVTFFLTLMV